MFPVLCGLGTLSRRLASSGVIVLHWSTACMNTRGTPHVTESARARAGIHRARVSQ